MSLHTWSNVRGRAQSARAATRSGRRGYVFERRRRRECCSPVWMTASRSNPHCPPLRLVPEDGASHSTEAVGRLARGDCCHLRCEDR
jgi:hypothetical protein